ELLERLAQLRVLEDVHVVEARTELMQRGGGLGGEAALRKIRRALHEQHHRRGGQLLADAIVDVHRGGLGFQVGRQGSKPVCVELWGAVPYSSIASNSQPPAPLRGRQ